MRHQIKYLLSTIIIFAGFATSALKAQEIEGTWTQDGQYKKFSKIYSNSILSTVSEDGQKMAFIVNDTLRIVEIATGILLDTCYLKADIPQNYTDEPSYSLSNNFSYVACRYNERKTKDTVFHYFEDLLIRKLDDHKIVIDTTIAYTINEVNIYGTFSGITSTFSRLFISDSIFCSFLNISATFAMRSEYHYKYSFAYNCTANQKLPNTPFSTYSYINRTNNGKNLLASCYTTTYTQTPSNGTIRIDENEFIFGYYNNIYHPISSRSWFTSNDPYNPGKNESNLNPIGITPDCKTAIISNSDREINLYNLVKAAPVTKLTDSTGNTKFPQIASPVVLFPNNVNATKLLYISRLNQLTLFSTLNYTSGATNTFGFSDKDYIVNSHTNFMIDSNRILSISDSKKIYLLDLGNVIPINNMDICSDFQSVSTNDTILFVAIYPESYRNIIVDFGDGTTSNASNVKHKYSQPGKYTITLTAKDSSGLEHKVVKNEYITVNQGVAINMDLSVEYLPNARIRINLKSNISGSYKDLNIQIADSIKKNIDSLSLVFTGLGNYYIRITCLDVQYNKLIIKDTIFKVLGPECSNIMKEDYLNTLFNYNIKFFKHKSGYIAFEDYGKTNCAISIDTNYNIWRSELFDTQAKLWNVHQLSNSIYSLHMSSYNGSFKRLYDYRKETPLNSSIGFSNILYFALNDDTLGSIELGTNDIILYHSNDKKYTKRIHTNAQFSNPTLYVKKNPTDRTIYIFDYLKNQGYMLYKFYNDSILEKISFINISNELDYGLTLSIKSTKNNVFELIDKRCVITLDFNRAISRRDSLQNLKIHQVVHINDSTIALVCVDTNYVINVCLVDSNYAIKEKIELPYRTSGTILYAEKNKQKQLDFVSYTSRNILFFCTVKISNDTIPEIDTISIIIDTINTDSLSRLTLFPNPTSNTLTVVYPIDRYSSVTLSDEDGKTIKAKILSKRIGDFTIDTSLLPEGIYFLQIQDGKINKSVKFMVKR